MGEEDGMLEYIEKTTRKVLLAFLFEGVRVSWLFAPTILEKFMSCALHENPKRFKRFRV